MSIPNSIKLFVSWDGATFTDESSRLLGNLSWSLGLFYGEHVANTSKLSFTLNNWDKRYSPENTVSPIYPNVKPHRAVYLWEEVSEQKIWTGWLEDIRPDALRYEARQVQCTAYGFKRLLDNIRSLPPSLTNVRADEIIRNTMALVDQPPGGAGFFTVEKSHIAPAVDSEGYHVIAPNSDFYELDQGIFTFANAGDTAQNYYDLINQAVMSEQGHVFENRAGAIVFWNNQHWGVNYPDSIPTIVDLHDKNGSVYVTPSGSLKNRVMATFAPRDLADTVQVLFTLAKPFTVSPGEATYKTTVNLSYQGVPVSASGLNVHNLGFTAGSATVTVEAIEGTTARLNVANSSENETAIVSAFELRGLPLTTDNAQSIEVEDEASINEYGLRIHALDLPLIQNADLALSIASYRLVELKRIQGRFESVGFDTTKTRANLVRDYTIGSTIRLEDSQLEHARDYIIIGESHTYEGHSKKMTTTWNLMPLEAPPIIVSAGPTTQHMFAAWGESSDPTEDLHSNKTLTESGSVATSTQTLPDGTTSAPVVLGTGSGADLSYPHSALGITGATPFTFELWINQTSVGAGDTWYLSQWGSGTNSWIVFRRGASSDLRVLFATASGNSAIVDAGPDVVGAGWTQIMLSYDPSALAVTAYRDGVQFGSVALPAQMNTPDDDLRIDGTTAFTTGHWTFARAWVGRALKSEHVTWLYNSGAGRTYSQIDYNKTTINNAVVYFG